MDSHVDFNEVTLEISHDDGKSWKPMKPGFQQVGSIVSIEGDVMVQSIGRGRTIRYRATRKA